MKNTKMSWKTLYKRAQSFKGVQDVTAPYFGEDTTQAEDWQQVPSTQPVEAPQRGEKQVNIALNEVLEELGSQGWKERNFWRRKALKGIYAYLRENYDQILDRTKMVNASRER